MHRFIFFSFLHLKHFDFHSFAFLNQRYKCHKECVPHAPANCGLSEGKLRRMIDTTDFQAALGKKNDDDDDDNDEYRTLIDFSLY